jgi:hypothetical protein
MIEETMARLPRDPVLRNIMSRADVLSEMERDLIGRAVRLHIPFVDQITLRTQAVILRELANHLEIASHSKAGEAQALKDAAREINIASRRLQSTKHGVRKKGGL